MVYTTGICVNIYAPVHVYLLEYMTVIYNILVTNMLCNAIMHSKK